MLLLRTFSKTRSGMSRLEPKWGHYPQFELALDHALKVQWDGFLHYDFFDRPDIRPRFMPIPPAALNEKEDTPTSAAVDTDVFIGNAEDPEKTRTLLNMGEQTCYLHAACRSNIKTRIRLQ